MNLITYARLATALDECLQALPGTAASGRHGGDWTPYVMEALAELGQAEKWDVAVSTRETPYGVPGLLDLTWHRLNDDGLLEGIFLALESACDQDLDVIQRTFQRLLVTLAPYKVFVCQTSAVELPEILALLQRNVAAYQEHFEGEYYFLALFTSDTYHLEVINAFDAQGGGEDEEE